MFSGKVASNALLICNSVTSPLPISAHLTAISEQLEAHSNLVLQAQPGAGKSTQVPLHLLGSSWLKGQRILMLEPRRLAAKSLATYLAAQLGETVGQRVGYQVRHERKISANTQLEIVTEGILTRRLQSDPELTGVGLVIFDEFHERSIHSDLGLMFCLEAQQGLRDDLRLLVMSATIDTQQISRYLMQAPVIECAGRSFEVAEHYLTQKAQRLDVAVANAVVKALQHDQGDVLVFLPGAGDIRRAQRQLSQSLLSDSLGNSVQVLPLYGSLKFEQQQCAISGPVVGVRKVILATNIAETSLTIEGITSVIDSGLERQNSYDPKTGLTRLQTQWISKASAEQRKGRAGRTQAGQCYRLWRASEQASLASYQVEQICLEDLTATVLDLHLWGLTQYQQVPWLSAPNPIHYEAAKRVLLMLKLIDDTDRVTPMGRQVAALGIEPRLGAMVIKAQSQGQGWLACQLAAILSERDMLVGQGAELGLRVMAWHEPNDFSVNQAPFSAVKRNASQWAKRLDIKPQAPSSMAQLQQDIGELLLQAYPDRLAKLRHAGKPDFTLFTGKGVQLADDDPLCGTDWLVVADADGQNQGGRIYLAQALSKEQVMSHYQHLQTEQASYVYYASRETIGATVTAFIGKISLSQQTKRTLTAEQFAEALPLFLKEHGLALLGLSAKGKSWLTRVRWLAQYDPRFTGFSEQVLIDDIASWLLDYHPSLCSLKQLQTLDVLSLLKARIDYQLLNELDHQAPSHYLAPSGKRIDIEYDLDTGPKVSVQLQELFGELQSPKLAFGQVNLCFELLSPARRPIQTTSDLGQFWQGSYVEVAKDMRGRYPKHRWPEEPLTEKPGRSIKRKH